jgi:arylsulfatase A-like enzyme
MKMFSFGTRDVRVSRVAGDECPTIQRHGLLADAAHPAARVSIALVVLLGYHFLFQVTKPSPLTEASAGAVVRVVSYGLLSVAALTVVLLPIALLGDTLGARWSRNQAGTTFTLTLVYFLGTLAAVENFAYTIFGFGLRNSNGLGLKLAFLAVAVAVAVWLARLTCGLSRQVRLRFLSVALPMLLAAAGVTGFTLARGVEGGSLDVAGESKLNNVVILSADGIDADRMSVYGYNRETTPFLKSRLPELVGFRNAFTNNGNTTGSITALMTGMSPLTTGVVYPPDRLRGKHALRTLPRLLGELGYYRSNWAVPHFADADDQNLAAAFDMNNGDSTSKSVVSRLPLSAGVARWFLAQTFDQTLSLLADVFGFHEMDNDFAQVAHVDDGSSLTDEERLQGVLEDVRRGEPFFINTHFMVSHGPRFSIEDPRFSAGQIQEEDFSRDFYDDALRQFDAYIAEVFNELERNKQLDNTLVIITSDHAVGYVASERVPLLIRYPSGASPGWHDVNVQRIDLAPTVLDLLGFKKPSWMEGSSLLAVRDLPHDRQIAALNTTSAEHVPDAGWVRGNDDTLLTIVRCNSYMTQDAAGEVRRGQVRGSTSPCRALPEFPSAGVHTPGSLHPVR